MGHKHLALLRGINVGGKNRILMTDLAALFNAAGATEIRTFIQSGNVVFDCPDDDAASIRQKVVENLETHMRGPIPIVFRTREELEAAISANPYLRSGCAEAELHLMFLADLPTEEAIASLDPNRSVPDEYTVAGRDVYLRLPCGVAESKLTNQYFDSRLKTIGTSRNWRTVNQLAALMS